MYEMHTSHHFHALLISICSTLSTVSYKPIVTYIGCLLISSISLKYHTLCLMQG
jgi:hypothetical protein